jgi:hypothetical protein
MSKQTFLTPYIQLARLGKFPLGTLFIFWPCGELNDSEHIFADQNANSLGGDHGSLLGVLALQQIPLKPGGIMCRLYPR